MLIMSHTLTHTHTPRQACVSCWEGSCPVGDGHSQSWIIWPLGMAAGLGNASSPPSFVIWSNKPSADQITQSLSLVLSFPGFFDSPGERVCPLSDPPGVLACVPPAMTGMQSLCAHCLDFPSHPWPPCLRKGYDLPAGVAQI